MRRTLWCWQVQARAGGRGRVGAWRRAPPWGALAREGEAHGGGTARGRGRSCSGRRRLLCRADEQRRAGGAAEAGGGGEEGRGGGRRRGSRGEGEGEGRRGWGRGWSQGGRREGAERTHTVAAWEASGMTARGPGPVLGARGDPGTGCTSSARAHACSSTRSLPAPTAGKLRRERFYRGAGPAGTCLMLPERTEGRAGWPEVCVPLPHALLGELGPREALATHPGAGRGCTAVQRKHTQCCTVQVACTEHRTGLAASSDHLTQTAVGQCEWLSKCGTCSHPEQRSGRGPHP